jgi:hydrogenase maturation factor
LANWAGVDLTRIDDLGITHVLKLLSEIGVDLSRFANVKHLCSWLGLSPGTKISGGKILLPADEKAAVLLEALEALSEAFRVSEVPTEHLTPIVGFQMTHS